MPRKNDLTGKRFGSLVAVRVAGKKNGTYVWECLCDCGNIVHAVGCDLTRGHTKSCGCLRRAKITEYNIKHGLSHIRIHTIWCGMKERCYNPNATNYQYYGGKGIAICEEWLHDFQAFYDWAVANGYREGLSIDRKDSDGNYCPQNCMWITRSENTTRANIKRWAASTACKK